MNLAYNNLSDRSPNKNNKYCIIPGTGNVKEYRQMVGNSEEGSSIE